MTMSADQSAAFLNNSGFKPDQTSSLFVALVLTLLLLWGIWAMVTAYRGWAIQKLSGEKFAGLVGRFFLMYAVVGFLLLKG